LHLFDANKNISYFVIINSLLAGILLFLMVKINSCYSDSSISFLKKNILTAKIPTASPALVPAGRNIAFESGNAITNAPASYLNMLDCCESDEAISQRLAMGDIKAKLIKKK
jgi:hypothetical protein